jgi:hypothetical protein
MFLSASLWHDHFKVEDNRMYICIWWKHALCSCIRSALSKSICKNYIWNFNSVPIVEVVLQAGRIYCLVKLIFKHCSIDFYTFQKRWIIWKAVYYWFYHFMFSELNNSWIDFFILILILILPWLIFYIDFGFWLCVILRKFIWYF